MTHSITLRYHCSHLLIGLMFHSWVGINSKCLQLLIVLTRHSHVYNTLLSQSNILYVDVSLQPQHSRCLSSQTRLHSLFWCPKNFALPYVLSKQTARKKTHREHRNGKETGGKKNEQELREKNKERKGQQRKERRTDRCQQSRGAGVQTRQGRKGREKSQTRKDGKWKMKGGVRRQE